MSYADKIKSITETSEETIRDTQSEQEGRRIRCLSQKVDVIMNSLHSQIEFAAKKGLHSGEFTPTVETFKCDTDNEMSSFSDCVYRINTNISKSYVYRLLGDNYIYGKNFHHTTQDEDFAYIPTSDFSTVTSLVSERLKKDGFSDFSVSFQEAFSITGKILKRKNYFGYRELKVTISW